MCMPEVYFTCFFKKIFKTYLLFNLIFFCLPASSLPQDEIEKLEKGLVIRKELKSYCEDSQKNITGSESKILINAPVEHVWNFVDEKENFVKFIDAIKDVEIVKEDELTQNVKISKKLSVFLPTFNYIIAFDKNENNKYKKMEFKKTEGHFKKIFGSFEFTPHKNSTILVIKYMQIPGFTFLNL